MFAKKHDGTKRMCVDYRRLKDLTKKVAYPMPRIDEYLDHMRESTVFTKMDLRSGFHQILVYTEHRERTAFQTRWVTSSIVLCRLGSVKRRPRSSVP